MKETMRLFSVRAFDSSSAGRKRTEAFVALLHQSVDQDVLFLIEKAKSFGHTVVLTTAAYVEYARPVSESLGFDGVVASGETSVRGWRENYAEAKLEMTSAWLEEHNVSTVPRLLVTDHRDDLPLARECAVVWWVGQQSAETGRLSDMLASESVFSVEDAINVLNRLA